MRKYDELASTESCLNREGQNEMLFVLRGHDKCAPMIIRAWCALRILVGKNTHGDPVIQEALTVADIMERER